MLPKAVRTDCGKTQNDGAPGVRRYKLRSKLVREESEDCGQEEQNLDKELHGGKQTYTGLGYRPESSPKVIKERPFHCPAYSYASHWLKSKKNQKLGIMGYVVHRIKAPPPDQRKKGSGMGMWKRKISNQIIKGFRGI